MNSIELSQDQLKEVENFAYSQMTLHDIAMILQVDLSQFAAAFYQEGSSVNQAIRRGQLRAKADVRRAVITAAASGSTPAIKEALELIKQFQNDLDFNYEASQYPS
jgi:hypothetical protein